MQFQPGNYHLIWCLKDSVQAMFQCTGGYCKNKQHYHPQASHLNQCNFYFIFFFLFFFLFALYILLNVHLNLSFKWETNFSFRWGFLCRMLSLSCVQKLTKLSIYIFCSGLMTCFFILFYFFLFFLVWVIAISFELAQSFANWANTHTLYFASCPLVCVKTGKSLLHVHKE